MGSEAYAAAERRILLFTLLLGGAAAIVAALKFSALAGVGVAVGAGLSWLNGRWMQQGLDAVAHTSRGGPQAPGEPRRARRAHLAKLLLRYVLLGLVIYVIFKFLEIPVVSVLLGLCALGAAAMAEFLYEAIARPN